jgi:hypothetical protein
MKYLIQRHKLQGGEGHLNLSLAVGSGFSAVPEPLVSVPVTRAEQYDSLRKALSSKRLDFYCFYLNHSNFNLGFFRRWNFEG